MKIVISISKEKDLLGSYDENSLREIILSDDVVNEFLFPQMLYLIETLLLIIILDFSKL